MGRMTDTDAIKANSEPVKRYTITLDDDPMMHRFIQKVTGINSLPFTSVSGLLKEAGRYRPVGAFIDVHLGTFDESGLDAIQPLRSFWPCCPLIVITSNPKEEAVIEALALGADDFIVKPIRPKELIARLQARQRDHAVKEAKNVLRCGDINFDQTNKLLVGADDRHVFLPPIESSLLVCMIQAGGIVVRRETLKHRCWGLSKVSDHALDRKIHELRSILRDITSDVTIKTIYGIGYVLDNQPALKAS
jgi:DNA-binding response OmpR family regulator